MGRRSRYAVVFLLACTIGTMVAAPAAAAPLRPLGERPANDGRRPRPDRRRGRSRCGSDADDPQPIPGHRLALPGRRGEAEVRRTSWTQGSTIQASCRGEGGVHIRRRLRRPGRWVTRTGRRDRHPPPQDHRSAGQHDRHPRSPAGSTTTRSCTGTASSSARASGPRRLSGHDRLLVSRARSQGGCQQARTSLSDPGPRSRFRGLPRSPRYRHPAPADDARRGRRPGPGRHRRRDRPARRQPFGRPAKAPLTYLWALGTPPGRRSRCRRRPAPTRRSRAATTAPTASP